MSTTLPNTVTQNPCVSLSVKTQLLFAWDVSIVTLRLFLSTTENPGFETSKEEEKTKPSAANSGKSFNPCSIAE